MIPPTLFQSHSELSNLSVGDLAEAADRLDKSCILSSTLYSSSSGSVDQQVLECT
jgi:hypothetical protein